MTATPESKPHSKWLDAELKYDSGVYNKHEVVMVRGLGATVWDENGRSYIDCVAGYGVANIGHSHPDVVKAIQEQAGKLMIMPQSVPNDKRAEFLQELVGVLPQGLERVFLCNSGTEAMEAAKKFAITGTGRQRFVSMKRGFSGRSLGALALTWEPKYREPFGDAVDNKNVDFVTYGNIEELRAAVTDQTAAVILEPVQGEGGVRPGTMEFIQEARRITKEKGALLIMDEIQTGFCRTGKMFATEHFGVTPDGMTLAKAMAGGVPIGAFVMTAEVADRMPAGGHGTTFGGNPLSMAAGIAAIRAMKREGMAEQAREKGAYFMERLRAIDSSKIREVRGMGLMIGVELKEKSAPYITALEHDEGVLALQATPLVVRFLPPITITKEQIDSVVDAFTRVLGSVNPRAERQAELAAQAEEKQSE
ncbi:aspartate aminotransferase family protein [Deinococcus radiopugnans]|uniref:[LysW]-aminoadipate semialdehyde transaminase n=1 Tax=Deinococcus radiopugnans ATCC 19172 TaxID=585398 RepID=A0A5C4Y936_9DEIO|nr:aspartate aminotransferase family protein [Deinococcus radiopugnans]MBB6016094.1 acetylornithine/LysW-gamma-L-lysine aminotransferase [Deinococcus radiopugnans ATCC 19172]TNM72121.1 aspartate aminotransferase family protein [Deinococcus radiopugnans ATCC 19172]